MSRNGAATGTPANSLVDAERFLELTQRLKAARARVDEIEVGESRRANWAQRLIAIADAAHSDLDKAEAQLERMEAELQRHS